VPGRIAGRRAARVIVAVAAAAALLPLTAAATAPIASQGTSLTSWLEAHHLRYGLGWYWDASMLTVVSDGQVQVCAVTPVRQGIAVYTWETYLPWFDASRYDARFVVAPVPDSQGFTTAVYHDFGRPAAVYRMPDVLILVYRTNLLKQLIPALPLQAAIARGQAAGVPATRQAGQPSAAWPEPAMAWSGLR
jgi:hypothetical protein